MHHPIVVNILRIISAIGTLVIAQALGQFHQQYYEKHKNETHGILKLNLWTILVLVTIICYCSGILWS